MTTALRLTTRPPDGAGTELGSRLSERVSGDTVRWARYLPATEAEGPGIRAAVWLQGCSVHCPGCFNPHLWAARGGIVDDTRELADRFVAEARAAGAEGITLLGGEPFDQADASATIAEAFRAAGLTVMTFTGYPRGNLEHWARERDDVARLYAATDLLADGPYLQDRPDRRRPWIGSVNQGLHALTSAYAREIAEIDADGGRDRVEVRIGADGTVSINGWAETSALEALLDDLGTRADGPTTRRNS